jgi:phosphoribosylanthranilate isomerase
MIKIKICGMTNKIDAVSAAGLGVDMLGFVFCKKSKRYVEPAVAKEVINELPPGIVKVGVFVDETAEKVRSIAEEAGLDILQFHGSETPEFCSSFRGDYKVIKAFRVKAKQGLKEINGYDVDYYLLDTFKADTLGGTGEVFDWKLLRDFELLKPVILSGGLSPANVGAAIAEVAPYGVDVSTGVEAKPGKKDAILMKKFVEKVRKSE